MTTNDFINNLHGLCDGQDFSRELLKVLFIFAGLVCSCFNMTGLQGNDESILS